MPTEQTRPATSSQPGAFHDLHRGDGPLLLPNAWDHASAMVLVEAGFPAIGTTSLGVAAAYGLPDGHGRTREPTVALARLLGSLPCLVTVDVEAGFSEDPAEVADLAAELVSAGVAGINLEDGRGDGTLADPGHQSELIAAVKAREPGLFVNARVDTYWLGVTATPGATVARAERYQAAGADGVFVPGALGTDEIASLVVAVDLPLNVLYLPAGPAIGTLADLGVRRISTGSLLFRAALQATVATATAIRDGAAPDTAVPTYADVQRLTETD